MPRVWNPQSRHFHLDPEKRPLSWHLHECSCQGPPAGGEHTSDEAGMSWGLPRGQQGAQEPPGKALWFRGFILLSLSLLNHVKIHTTLNLPSFKYNHMVV